MHGGQGKRNDAIGGDEWIGPPAGALLVRQMDQLTLAFDRRSGQTHVMASPLPEILEALGDGCLTLDALLARLSSGFEVESEGAALAALAARLEEAALLGLVARRSGPRA